MKKSFFIFFILIFLGFPLVLGYNLSSVYYTNIIMQDDFNYGDSYSLHPWTFSGGFASEDYVGAPHHSPFGTNGFGYNRTTPLAFTHSIAIYTPTSYDTITTGHVLVGFNISIVQDSKVISSIFDILVYAKNQQLFNIKIPYNSYNYIQTVPNSYYSGGAYCNSTNISSSRYLYGDVLIDIDIDEAKYSIYFNKTDIGCNNVSIRGNTRGVNSTYVRLQFALDTSETLNVTLDSFKYGQGYTSYANISLNCTDSDGDNHLTQGLVFYDSGAYEDYCVDSLQMGEYTCSGGIVDANIYDCSTEYGEGFYCSQGRCIEATTSACEYPSLFCDDFNYAYDVSIKNWSASDSEYNFISLSPDGETLNLTGNTTEHLQHRIDNFNLQYIVNGYLYLILDMQYTPLMSADFEFIPTSNKGNMGSCMFYQGESLSNAEVFDFAFCMNDSSFYYKNGTGADDLDQKNWVRSCSSCINDNSTNSFKVITKFKNRKYYKEFNSTFVNDTLTFYLNGDLKGENIPVPSGQGVDATDSLRRFTFTKEDNITIGLDNYKVYTGDNSGFDTTQDYISSVALTPYESPSNVTIGTGQSNDFATAVSSIWYDFGLRSTASRVLFATLLMFFLALAYVLISMAWHYSPSPIVLLVLQIFAVIILTYVGLLPVWILILLGILSILVTILIVIMRRG